MKRRIKCNCFLFAAGGLLYGLIEILWRSYTHWSMLLTGGFCFTLLYKVFKKISLCPVYLKCLIGSGIITTVEFVSGCIFNKWLKYEVWDYSSLPMNFRGQICLPYSILWGFLTLPIIMLCNFLKKRFRL